MAVKQRSLEILEDIEFEKRQWRVQRVGWIAMALILLLAAAGGFGKGPLSHASARNEDIRVDYERFPHSEAPSPMEIEVSSGRGSEANVRIAFNRSYLELVPFTHLDPEPLKVEVTPDELIFEFAAVGDRPVRLSLEQTAHGPGTASARIRRADAALETAVHFKQIRLP